MAKTYRRKSESAIIERTGTGFDRSEGRAECSGRDGRSGNADPDRAELYADTWAERFIECYIAERAGSESATK